MNRGRKSVGDSMSAGRRCTFFFGWSGACCSIFGTVIQRGMVTVDTLLDTVTRKSRTGT